MLEEEKKKKENIETVVNNNKEEVKKKKIRARTIIVLLTLIIFIIATGIVTRANYLEVLEIGEDYVESFMQDVRYKINIGIVNFIFAFIAVYVTTNSIKKGLKKFFEDEKKEMPKLPNKSIAFIVAIIVSVVTANMFLEKTILFVNCTQFGITDPIFNLDVGFYMFQAPLIGQILYYFLFIAIGLIVYIGAYYIIVFNKYFDGVDRTNIKE